MCELLHIVMCRLNTSTRLVSMPNFQTTRLARVLHWHTSLDNTRMTPFILINPHAAGGRARKLKGPIQAWCEALPAQSAPPQIIAPENIENALSLLSDLPPRTRVVLVGGDLTLAHTLLT